MMNDSLRLLMDGKYICPVAFPAAFEHFESQEVQHKVDTWLGELDMRLARLGEDGAYFMAPRHIEWSDASRVRDEFVRFRDIYGPAVQMLNLVRQAKESFECRMGDVLQLAELMAAVADSATLETQLRGMYGLIAGTSLRLKNREFLQKLLEHLRSDGYLFLTNPQTETYTVTGKIDQLAAALQYIAEHESIRGDEEEDQLDEKEGTSLFDAGPSTQSA